MVQTTNQLCLITKSPLFFDAFPAAIVCHLKFGDQKAVFSVIFAGLLQERTGESP